MVQDEKSQLRVKIENPEHGGSCRNTDTCPCLPGAVLGTPKCSGSCCKELHVFSKGAYSAHEGLDKLSWRSVGPMERDMRTDQRWLGLAKSRSIRRV